MIDQTHQKEVISSLELIKSRRYLILIIVH